MSMRCNYNATDMFPLVACCLYIWSSVLYIDAFIFLHGYTYFLQPYKNLYGCYALLRRVILSGGSIIFKKVSFLRYRLFFSHPPRSSGFWFFWKFVGDKPKICCILKYAGFPFWRLVNPKNPADAKSSGKKNIGLCHYFSKNPLDFLDLLPHPTLDFFSYSVSEISISN